ncbi:MAG TPA: aminoacetone oxidase family FAD-binding enzyme [Flavobacteriales bacterium]|jgi:predicted Rossmann fold flavoprotein|nr:aminoacetone oxidase family FAD-binding enzyme [Flavobacteriales bacterium]
MDSGQKVAVIGGGAAGFFAALSAAEHHPNASVVLFEKSNKLLAKVKVSGGGRCNVTHACFSPALLSKNYPRGGKQLKKAFSSFHAEHTVDWFTSRGVPLKTEDDGRMFPQANTSQAIIDCLMNASQSAGIEIRMSSPVTAIHSSSQDHSGFELHGERFDRIIVATGGSPKSTGFDWLRALGHSISDPVPSLFTFNMPGESVTERMGLVVHNAIVRIQGTKLSHQGPVLITHWGMSGPAVLKLSAWGARELEQRGYGFTIQVNWVGLPNEAEVLETIEAVSNVARKKKMVNACPFDLPKNFWTYLLEKSGLDPDSPWMELGKKGRNRLANTMLNDTYTVKGKTTFKEEFVTCGGVMLGEVDFKTMQSRVVPGLYFAGEVLDVDGITGGFNFQAAWTTGFVAGQLQ